MSKKLRPSERRKRRRREKAFRVTRNLTLIFMIIAFFGVIATVSYLSLTTGMFEIKEIEVTGAEILSPEQIIEASGIKEGDNIFSLSLNDARYNISRILTASDIVIKKVLPDKIIIQVDESAPLGIIQYENKNYYLEDDGKLMMVTDPIETDSAPVLSGFSEVKFGAVGEEPVINPPRKWEQVKSIIKLFAQNGLEGDIAAIAITENNNYQITTRKGVVFTVKNLSNFQEYFNYISSVIENGETNVDINLTIGNNPIKKAR